MNLEPIELDSITADNMRKLVKKNSQLEEVLRKIVTDADKGKQSITIDGPVESATRSELERRGFHVEIGGRFNEKDTFISWSL